MKKAKAKRLASCAVLCALSASMALSTGCGKKEEKKKIAVITKQDISFWHDVQDGAADAGKELGVDILYNKGGTSDYPQGDNDYATQIEYINYAVNQKVDAIVIAPNDPTELNEALARAQNAGIEIININSRANFDGVLTCISSSDTDGGSVAARNCASLVLSNETLRSVFSSGNASIEDVKKYCKGAVGIIGHTASTANNRIEGFKAEAQQQIQYQMMRDGMRIAGMGPDAANNSSAEAAPAENGAEMGIDASVEAATEAPTAAPSGEVRTNGGGAGGPMDMTGVFDDLFVEGERCSTIDAAYEETKKLLTASDSNVLCVFTTNTNTTIGACKAVEELGLAESVSVIGFNSDEEELNYLKTGVLDGTVVQNPYNMGYIGVRYAISASNGDGIPGAVDTGVTYVTADNLNDDYVQLLLYPENY